MTSAQPFIHPFELASPFFRTLPLARYGLEWIEPQAMLAHPFDAGTSALVHRALDAAAEALNEDGPAYRRLRGPIVAAWPQVEDAVLGPLRWPRHPLAVARFGLQALRSAERLARHTFRGSHARGLFAGIAAHGMLPLDRRPSAAFGLVLGAMAHVVDWVLPRGRSGPLHLLGLNAARRRRPRDVRVFRRVSSARRRTARLNGTSPPT